MTGFNVEIEALSGYGENLASFKEQAGTFGELTDTADVGDESWGVVGIMTKGKYDEALAELKNLIEAMKEGLDSTADKIGTAAAMYRGDDEAHAMNLGGFLVDIDTSDAGGAGTGNATDPRV
ncbi:type VII secretion target [Prauserella rugosa]|uniref:Excreted virulence factor EspC (Type VII ESX diderm) n=1 Tax=Prauserella rugosa TaxID=43354 RepID=A0A660CFI6_9PSEU|nr:type VII secretion target [Prauserella rugosa]KMS91375.1 hypothetical protein ACZ91_10025 [Streptomyces regensis]TWH22202.1 excreted virulence factor EspC (type VII ESX diderm) [Prauserella rugosa]